MTTGDLAGLRIGIDGSYFIRKLAALKEPYLSATGGLPLSFADTLKQELLKYKQANVQLFLVFNGLQWRRGAQEKPFAFEDRRPLARQQAWDFYAQGKTDAALSAWGSTGSVPQNDLLPVVFSVLDEMEVEYIRAPYSALAQLAYMDKHSHPDFGFFDIVYAGSEYLLFDVDRVMTSVDFQRASVTFIDKQVVLQNLACSADQFLDMGILAGFDFISTFPALLDAGSNFSFQLAVDTVKMSGGGLAAVKQHQQHPQVQKLNYLDLFMRVRCVVKFHLVWKDSGQVEPLLADKAPSDLDDVIGMRLPDVVYYYLMRCWISPQVVQPLITGQFVEQHPLCSGNVAELRKYIVGPELSRLRAQALAFLVLPFNDAYKQRNVESFVWYDQENGQQIAFGQELLLFDSSTKWSVQPELVQQLSESHGSRIPVHSLEFALTLLSQPAVAKQTLAGGQPKKLTFQVQDSQTEVLLANMMTLAQCGYIDIKSHQLSPIGSALFQSTKQATDGRAVEWMWLLSELLKSGAFQPSGYSPSHDVATGYKSLWFLSRLACILPATTTAAPYAGPLKRDLLTFHAFMRSMTKSLRALCETALLSRAITTQAPDQTDSSVAGSLPFSHDQNTLMGTVVAVYLDACLSGKDGKKALAATQEKMKTWLTSIEDDLKRFFAFWKCVTVFVNAAKSALMKYPAIADHALVELVQETDKWLQPYILQ